MATPYLDSAKLDAILGSKVMADGLEATFADVDAVIAAQCALADGYVAAQVALPPSATAIEQVAPTVAELVYCALYVHGGSPELATRRAAAIKSLQDIAKGLFLLHRDPVPDNPATVEDESATGSACGSAPRQTLRRQLSEGFDARW
jgi:hypothetical protein